MGCDIHSIAQKKVDGVWITLGLTPFDWRSYGLFGFLADVRNYSMVPSIAERRGLPEDLRPIEDKYDSNSVIYDLGDHSFSWLSVDELLQFDYDKEMEDRRYMDETGDGRAISQPGQGIKTTFRKFLGLAFFKELEQLKAAGAERIVFGFDN